MLNELMTCDARQPRVAALWKQGLAYGASALVLAVSAGPAAAQAVLPTTMEPEARSVEEVVVTGSRVVRDGFQAPTPLTVISEQDLEAAAPSNLADFVNDIPSIQGSATVQTGNANISAGTAGINALNLRNLGGSRTLVLLDGQRSVASTITGQVDINTFPQGLIKSVEIVTGGASAAYGSDAVSGVVNFILDKELTGIKGSIEAGQTTYGDNDQYRLNLSAGLPFMQGRGKVLLNAELTDREGIYGVPRDWNNKGYYIVNNPAYAPGNGQPERLVTYNAGPIAAPGGVIWNGPLRGTAFGVGGAVYQQSMDVARDPWLIGGDWERNQANKLNTLDADERRKSLFGRVSYEIADNLEVFGQASWTKHASYGWLGRQYNQGNVSIRSDNAFLPQSVREDLQALNITSFNLGTSNADFPVRGTNNNRQVGRYVVGANGEFEAFGDSWRWDAYYQYGRTRSFEMAKDITNNNRLAMATDAVFHPVTGEIVCRSTLTDPNNGCVPLNRFGVGVASPEAIAWTHGDIYRIQYFTQEVMAANLSGDPFSTWAGPVSLALGVEHRKEKVSGYVPPGHSSGWFVGNYLPNFGAYDVTEGYVETVIPLWEGLDFNGAVRATDYSTSGFVMTWKAGFTYSPIPDIRFRVTRSRDIRAPNLNELFAAGTSRSNQLIDPFMGNTNTQFLEVTTGNLALKPEKADTLGLGVVVQPRFLPGFAASLDYYDIKINDAIGSVDAQRIVDRCFQGKQEYCAAIQRSGQFITRVSISPFNFAKRQARGFDMEASYRFDLGAGAMTLRGVATRYLENYNDNGIDPPTDSVGSISLPKFVYRATATWRAEPWTIQVVGRGVSSSTISNDYVVCQSACPGSTTFNPTINYNHVNSAFYLDTSITYDIDVPPFSSTQLFVNVNNILNADPELVPYGPAGTAWSVPQTDQGVFDILGRVFRVGLRFRY